MSTLGIWCENYTILAKCNAMLTSESLKYIIIRVCLALFVKKSLH